MRVISGEYRSRVLQEVASKDTRETKDRVKESIFNSIQSYIYDAKVLDLFAGSGSLAIEALSRGASHATLVDQSALAQEAIKTNVKNLRIEEDVDIYYGDYLNYLEKTYHTFDIILLDPPYKLDVIDDIIKLIARKRLLSEDGIIVSLYSKDNQLNKENNGIIEYKHKTIGITNVSFMKWRD